MWWCVRDQGQIGQMYDGCDESWGHTLLGLLQWPVRPKAEKEPTWFGSVLHCDVSRFAEKKSEAEISCPCL